MNRAARLKPIIKLAEQKQRHAAIDMISARKQLMSCEDKLAQMKTFRTEYNEKLADTTNPGRSSTNLNELHRFIRQLDEGIAALERQILQLKTQKSSEETAWRDARARADALEKLKTRINLQEISQLLEFEELEVEDNNRVKGDKY